MTIDGTNLPRGFRAAAVKAGIKPSGGLDLALLVADGPCAAAGTFTTNRFAAAPVLYDRELLPADAIRAVVVNAGNANAATGARGIENAWRTVNKAAALIGCRPDQVLVASTGVIGQQLPIERLELGLESAVGALTHEPSGFEDVSRAIMTTDTKPKVLQSSFESAPGRQSRLIGLAKGAAMIGPRMATMLAFLLTDAPVAREALQGLLKSAVDDSFNCVSVEGHASTNDTVLLLSLASPDAPPLEGPALGAFTTVVRETCSELARMIVDDGEGVTHRIKIVVKGAQDREEARAIARNVANDALVKTAIHGADPNWGRIVSAAGYAGVPFEAAELKLALNGTPLYARGNPLRFDPRAVSAGIRDQRDVTIELTLERGQGEITFWTTDLTAEYVRLNADYTT